MGRFGRNQRYNNRGGRGGNSNDNGNHDSKRPKFDDARHFKSFHLSKLPSNIDQPGSYTRLFGSSYSMLYNDCIDKEGNNDNINANDSEKKNESLIIENKETNELMCDNNSNIKDDNVDEGDKVMHLFTQVVHVHVNGLCIVTAGNDLIPYILQKRKSSKIDDDDDLDINKLITKIKYVMKHKPPPNGVGGKNKKKVQAQIIRQGGRITPKDPLIEITLWDNSIITLYSCVLGTLIEWNERIVNNPSLLITSDPLSNYLAIFLPLGSFPPHGLVVLEDDKKISNEKQVSGEKMISVDSNDECIVKKEE